MTLGYQKVDSANFSKLLAVKPMPAADTRFGPPALFLKSQHPIARPIPPTGDDRNLALQARHHWCHWDLALTWPVTVTLAGQGTPAQLLRHRGD